MAEIDIQKLRSQLFLQRRELLVGAGLFVVSLALWIFAIVPQWNRLQVVQADIQREQTALQKIQQRAALVTDLGEDDLNNFQTAGLALPLGKQPIVVLQTMEEVSRQSGVSLGKYDLNPGVISTQAAETTRRRGARSTDGPTQVQTMPLSVEMIGEFEDIQSALRLIEETLPVMEVVEISLNPEKQVEFSTPTTSYRVSLLIQTFFAPLDARELARQGATPLNQAQQEVLEMLLGMEYRLTTTPEEQTGPLPQFNNPNLFGTELAPTPVPATPTPTPSPTPLPEIAPVGPEGEGL